jgi:hypothetical protein
VNVLYAADYFKPSLVDQEFSAEAEAFEARGFGILAVNIDDLGSAGSMELPLKVQGVILYRGWMLDTTSYSSLVETVQRAEGIPFTSLEEYLLTHHIPNWVSLLSDMTPETVVLPNGSDFETELRALGWREFFVKDYVKSLKTSMGSRISDPAMIGRLVEEMERFRGSIEGGLCVRRVEDLRSETEQRYFVLHGKPYAADGSSIPRIVSECAERISSPFFSVDVARNANDTLRVVELGDGQVSDAVGWEIDRFTGLFAVGGMP